MWRLGRTLRGPVPVSSVRQASSMKAAASTLPLSKPLPNFQLTRAEQKPSRGRCEMSKFENKVTVASMETDSPVAMVSVVMRAGSRFEQPDEIGVSHALRRLAFKSTKSHSIVHMARMPELVGGNYWSTSGRENIAYNMEFLVDNAAPMMECLTGVIAQPAFHHWEVRDAIPQMHHDRKAAFVDQTAEVLESVHRAAYRNTLQNSIFCQEHSASNIDDTMVRNYFERLVTGPRIAVAGVGIPHEELVQLCLAGGLHQLRSNNVEETSSIFTKSNQEIRMDNGNESVAGAVVAQGASVTGDNYLVAAILQRVLGTGVYVQFGCNAATSRITSSSEKAHAGGAKVSTINFNYSDSGLFGVMASARRETIRPCLKAAWQEVSRAANGVSVPEFERAKAHVKADLLRSMETREQLVEDIANQTLLRGKYMSPENVVELVDKVTPAQVSNFAKSVASSPRVMALNGDLRDAPYLSDF